MRFITEFELKLPSSNISKAYISNAQFDMGNMIGDLFGWKEAPFKNMQKEKCNRWTLEIEAFPMERWIEFKSRLFSNFIDHDYEHAEEILMIIKELESFGKPAGEVKK